MSWANLHDEIAEEFGAAERVEFFGADGYSFRRLGSLDDEAFAKLTGSLYWRAWRKKNPERARAYVAAYMARDPERKRKMRQARKARYRKTAKGKAAQAASFRRWYAKNRERVLSKMRAKKEAA